MLNRVAFFTTLFAGAGLAAAALVAQPAVVAAEPQPETPAMIETVAHAPVGWHLVREGDRAKLAYGVADTDQILVMFTCSAGDPMVEVFGLAAPETDSVRFTSTALTTDIAVESEFDPMSGSVMIDTEVPMTARALQGFRASGRLTLTADDGAGIPAHAVQAEQAEVEAFFDHCERRSL